MTAPLLTTGRPAILSIFNLQMHFFTSVVRNRSSQRDDLYSARDSPERLYSSTISSDTTVKAITAGAALLISPAS